MPISASEQQKLLQQVVEGVRRGRESIHSIGCKIDCYEEHAGLLYEANWTVVDDHILLRYTHITNHSKGLPSAFYFDGHKNYFIEVENSQGILRSSAHVLSGSAPLGEPSPLSASYFFFGSWLDDLITNHKAKITSAKDVEKFDRVYVIRIEIPRRILLIEVAQKFDYAIVKTSELSADGTVVHEADGFEQYADAWLPNRSDFCSIYTDNLVTSTWRRSYEFSYIMANILSLSAATWKYAPGSTITDVSTLSKVCLIDGEWKQVATPRRVRERVT